MSAALLANITVFVVLYVLVDLFYRKIVLCPVMLSIQFRMKVLERKLYWLGREQTRYQDTCQLLRTQIQMESLMTPYISLRLLLVAFFMDYRGSTDALVLDRDMRKMCAESPEFKEIYIERLKLIDSCLKFNTPLIYVALLVFSKVFKFQINPVRDYFMGAVQFCFDFDKTKLPKFGLTMRHFF